MINPLFYFLFLWFTMISIISIEKNWFIFVFKNIEQDSMVCIISFLDCYFYTKNLHLLIF